MNFGSVAIGSTAERVVTLTNRNAEAVTMLVSTPDSDAEAAPTATKVAATLSVRRPFTVTDGCSGTVVQPGHSCTMTYAFAPTVSGPFAAAQSISININGSTELIQLRGRDATFD